MHNPSPGLQGRARVAALAVLLLLLIAPLAHAQTAGVRTGEVLLTGWPYASADEAPRILPHALAERRLLPFIDTLSLAYRYEAGGEAPSLALDLAWVAGSHGIRDGRVRSRRDLPEDLRMAALELRADVYLDGLEAPHEPVTSFVVVVDSMLLGPAPNAVAIDLSGLTWETVFPDTPADEARRYFAEGFTLRNPEVGRIGFAAFGDEGRRVARAPRRATYSDVYVHDTFIDVVIDLGWLFGSRRYEAPRGDDGGRRNIGRGALAGAGRTTERGGRRSRERSDAEAAPDEERETRSRTRGLGRLLDGVSNDDEEDEEDDDNELAPAAVVAGLAVVGLAVAGGTVGLFGTSDAPLGLSSGYVRPGGGVLLQASVNEALLAGDGGDKHLAAYLTFFFDAFDSRIQPALGLGAHAVDSGDVATSPSVSLGVAGNFGALVLVGGYDVVGGGGMFSASFNFRSFRMPPTEGR